jgi:hypothetical protein
MAFDWWIDKARVVHSKYLQIFVFLRQGLLHNHTTMLCLYIHCFIYFASVLLYCAVELH